MKYGKEISKGNIISDDIWKKIVKYQKENTRTIPIGTTFFKYDGSHEISDKEKTSTPTFGLAYLCVIKSDIEEVCHTGVLERPCMEKIEELERRGYTWEQIRNGDVS